MPGVVRKLLIYATQEGLVLQPHGSEYNHSLRIDYKSQKIRTQGKQEHSNLKDDAHLESYGIIGLIHIASLSFLIAVTRREQVAQILGQAVYVIADVAVVPLSSQSEASEAIIAASQSQDRELNTSDADYSESEDEEQPGKTESRSGSPTEDEGPYLHANRSNTSFAENVAKRKASFGKFASQWFSREAWGSQKRQEDNNTSTEAQATVSMSGNPSTEQDHDGSEAAKTNEESRQQNADKAAVSNSSALGPNASAMSLLPKILRSTKLILSSRSFYFSHEFDLTRRFALQDKQPQYMARDELDPLFFWNKRIGSAFINAGHEAFIMPIIQGFVGQRTFSVVKPTRAAEQSECVALSETTSDSAPADDTTGAEQGQAYLLTLISRRSVKRSGLRYLRRGIDDEGNCANTAETEQIISSSTWDLNLPVRSFVQLRGSIPLYFSQTPYSLKPAPTFHNSPSANEAAFQKHFKGLTSQYGAVQIATLIDKHGTEVAIGNAYEHLYQQIHDAGQLADVRFEWFDFHHECRGFKFGNVQLLVNKLQPFITECGETVINKDGVQTKQKGIIRTNCMDCLDRTNVAQSAFGQQVLQRALEEDGYSVDLVNDESTNWFNTLWADNGDAISRQYASTAALKGDFTRTRKRNWRGQLNDLGLTLSRYYSNMVNDYFSQAVIDLLLENVSWKIFEDFESTMVSRDPGISVASAREAAIENCSKIVIQNSDEDLIHGWTMLSPAQENTLRTLPLEETVVLLTDAAVYCCKFDWDTEKVARFEKVDLRSISKIRHGTYVTSTFSERQMNEDWNQGLVIVYTPGKGDGVRVNTRSLQNSINLESKQTSSSEGGFGILSWFAPKGSSSQASRTLALKVITRSDTVETEGDATRRRNDMPHVVASRISEEIKRVVVGSEHLHEHPEFIEEGDIISAADAIKRTGYLEQLGHSIKKMVWT